jgi:hypothetical protein
MWKPFANEKAHGVTSPEAPTQIRATGESAVLLEGPPFLCAHCMGHLAWNCHIFYFKKRNKRAGFLSEITGFEKKKSSLF